MSEDNNNKQTNDGNDNLKEELDRAKSEKAVLEMKLRKSDNDLYSDDYLEYLQNKKESKPQQNSFTSGGRLNDYSDEEISNMPITKLVGLIKNDVYTQIKSEDNKERTKKQRDDDKEGANRKKVEAKKFAREHPDIVDYLDRISELEAKHPTLNIEDLYEKAKREALKNNPQKQGEKPKLAPDTRPQAEGGIQKSDKGKPYREIISEEYKKLK